jgi:hypothetical protein
MVALSARHIWFLAANVACVILTTACVRDPRCWDTAQMARELTTELRRFAGLSADLEEHHVLAWRVDTEAPLTPSSRPLPEDRRRKIQVGLLWGRTRGDPASARWVLVHGFRDADGTTPWQREIINRELKAPLLHPRPGEDRYGNWRGFHMFERPPTSREICDFADVQFFDSRFKAAGYIRRVAGAVRKHTWARVAGEDPVCGFADERR